MRMLAGYRRSLDWTLGHQALVLLVGVGTLAGTVRLYIIVPKGFLPQQDTGVLVAVTEARAERLHPAAWSQLQTQVAEIVERDPAVTGVVSFVGAGTINADAQHRPADHRAEAERRARSGAAR